MQSLLSDIDNKTYTKFYHAMRSSNVEQLSELIHEWSSTGLDELDEILSKVYEELKLKNVELSDEVQFLIEDKLIDLRFFSQSPRRCQTSKDNFNTTRERIELVFENIDLLSDTEEINEKFLFVLTSIAQNIHILKRQLKSTYDKLPWEEIEFILVCFVSSYKKQQELNLFYYATLNKTKILNYLEIFSKILKNELSLIDVTSKKLAVIPNQKREAVVISITKSHPELEEMYDVYKQIRDVSSLKKMSDYFVLALSADPNEKEGQLIITRVLQVLGEYLKNTLESPKLSENTSEVFLLSLSVDTRKIIIKLRNSFSHAYSLRKRLKIEENTDGCFYSGVQSDIKKIDTVITDILNGTRMKMIGNILREFIDTEGLGEIKGFTAIFSKIDFSSIFKEYCAKIMEQGKVKALDKLEVLVKELSDIMTDKTSYEQQLFSEINKILNSANTRSHSTESDYMMAFAHLSALNNTLDNCNINHNHVRIAKFSANLSLQNIAPKVETQSIKKVAELSMRISKSIKSRLQNDTIDRLISNIWFITEFETGNVKWIRELREKMNEEHYFLPINKQKGTMSVTNQMGVNHIAIKQSELRRVLKSKLDGQLIEKLSVYKTDRKLQAVVEMLVLDILSILGTNNSFENNLLFLDDYTPVLTGKNLRNHLAHDNVLLDILISDVRMNIALNAKRLVQKSVSRNTKFRFVEDSFRFREKYDRALVIITNQEKMFDALERGNLQDLKDCLKKGADLYARNIALWTTLHFAAKGPSLNVVKFVLNNNVSVSLKEITGQSPLHTAAAYGRKSIVEFFLKETSSIVDEQDHRGKTPLHFASQNGHKKTVEVLLKHKADTSIKDIGGNSPLHHAFKNNHVEVAKILSNEDENVDINEVIGGFSSLHIAAEEGHLELVNFLLLNEANVNAVTDKGCTPLHGAALNGHLGVVNGLILKGADVNAKVLDGSTPLHYAVENGHEDIVNILLKHGANVNAFDKTYHYRPLHRAAKDGYENIARILLENQANGNVTSTQGISPLHFAVQHGHLGIVSHLLEYGVDIHSKDVFDRTPIHYAIESNDKKLVEILLENGAEMDTRDKLNITPLHLAVSMGYEDISIFLIKNKAEVNTQDSEGRTLLHEAARNGSKDIVNLLIRNKADVNARCKLGLTPLHVASSNGHCDAIDDLIKNGAEVDAECYLGITPLHAAIFVGHKNVVNLLIKHKAQVNPRFKAQTPLHIAVEAGHREIVEILVANGADCNVKCSNRTPLFCAIKCNRKKIVEILIKNGANVNENGGELLFLAVFAGYRDILEVLLESQPLVDTNFENMTLLHVAAVKGHQKIVSDLIKKGADVNAIDTNNQTPLCAAAQEGHDEIVQILIECGAEVDIKSLDGSTPLSYAAARGYEKVVNILLQNKADVTVRDEKNRTPLEMAVARSHLQVVKILANHKKVDINAKGNDNWTLLHIASQENNMEMVKYLIEKGCDMNAKNRSGSMPIHIAAREGHENIVKFLLCKGSNMNELGTANQTLLHYAALGNHVTVVLYLILQGADVNARDSNGLTPLHLAACGDNKDVIEALLRNGAFFNTLDNFRRRPLDLAHNKDSSKLASTEKLLVAVKRNDFSEVQKCIKSGAIINAKSSHNETSLHLASWKGYADIVDLLLQNEADLNLIGNKGCTPLHYAAKFSHLKIVKALLTHGAIYNASSDGGKTPLDFTSDKSIKDLLVLLRESFKKVDKNNTQVITDLNKLKDIDTLKAIMSAHNQENRTLVTAAVHSKFSKVKALKEVSQGDVSTQIIRADMLFDQGHYEKASIIFKDVFEKRKAILGSENPGTLDIQVKIALVLYKQGVYQEALNILEEIIEKQKDTLGKDSKDILYTRSITALVLHRQGKDEEALMIYQDVYHKQIKILGPSHDDTCSTQFHMALVLNHLGKHEEALTINRTLYERRKKMLGENNTETVRTQNNIALVLTHQGKYEEALKIYKEVLEKKKILLGVNHLDTLRTLHNIAGIFAQQKKYHEALETQQEVLEIQQKVLGPEHPETLITQYNIGNTFFVQGKWTKALKAYTVLDKMKIVFGSNHPSVFDISKKMGALNQIFKLQNTSASEVLQHLQNDINTAALNGDAKNVQRLLDGGIDVNDPDSEGRTPLHFAASGGDIIVVKILLNNGADVTRVTYKGNTPMHTATSKGYKEIVEILLNHVNHKKINDFVNAKTTGNGTTSLHVAAKNGSLDITMSLLKGGAIYNINDSDGKTPLDLSKNQNVMNLLHLVDALFKSAENGNENIISHLGAIETDKFAAVTNARNSGGKTLLQVAIANKHKKIASQLLEMLKKFNNRI